jgi:hypothetical protein
MRKIVCVSVPFILSQYHLISIQRTLTSIKSSQSSSPLYTIGVANKLRTELDDVTTLSSVYDEVILNDKNILARAWNIGIQRAKEINATHILVHNLDITLHSQSVERLANASDENPDFIMFSPQLWQTKKTLEQAQLKRGVYHGGHMCCFMVRPDFLDIVGQFDELFAPAYQEDADMFQRLRLSNHRGAFANDAYMFHTEGGTLRGCLTLEGASSKDKIAIASAIITKVKENDQRYIEKWGGPLGGEIYKTPFNKPLSIKSTKQTGYD